MSNVIFDMGMSLDGFIAGPNAGPRNALGDGGMRIHRWVFDLESWRERQSLVGGQTNRDDEVSNETFARTGAYVMGRRMFDEGEVGWPDPPPFRAPVFVLTHHERKPWVRQGGTTFTFVTDGIESAIKQARAAAGDKDVRIAGGANTIQQFIKAGLLDELQIHLAPILLGDGVRLFDHPGTEQIELEKTRVIDSPRVTHLTFRVVKED
ncbi:MAG: dihydrofolate reductase family protein [Actinomycetota bacterium]|jgi:dihydrofolate reductase|nr:dihydrofolate reductase [Rubrobacteraceae bacterium]MBA3635341.1 dihydrofolate reductase [Rubrobacteraceae bacterium]MBA3702216.1 dihydrofolate reductase [Rubrobacteraceae bacterium]MDQ3183658.1 dihydrofolate reductase family protein [Actinomycetota bacterium]MDQ3437338.1 dihydrofolate reductase family protein [Actinomycetota bacterium]